MRLNDERLERVDAERGWRRGELEREVGSASGSFVEAGHYEPFYYYLAKLPEAFLPWNLLTYQGLWHFRKQLLQDRKSVV